MPRHIVLRECEKLLRRRKFMHIAAGAAALPVMSRIACALDYPMRPVRLVGASRPGSASDIVRAPVCSFAVGHLRAAFSSMFRLAPGHLAAEVSEGRRPTATAPSGRSAEAINARSTTTSIIQFRSATLRRSRPPSGTPTSWWSIHHSRPRPFRSPSHMPRPIREKSNGLGRHRHRASCFRRTVHDVARRQDAARAVSRQIDQI